MRRFLLSIAFFVISLTTVGQEPPQKGAGPGKPLSPQEAQKLFKIDDGLRIELVACEPQIESPVAMQFDPDGRLWVVEMRDYPNGPGKGEKPAGRIRILEDKDGDGFFETSTIWADNLLFANGLLLWKDGAIVTKAPHVVHLRDTKGAGKADKSDVWYEGFAEQNPQLRVSHPILGLDGWIYCANGLRGGKVVRADDARAPVDISGMDFRFDPVATDFEAITGPGQYGNTFDEWGNRFVCDNRHHLRHVVMENRYIKRNPYLAAPALLHDVSVLEDGPLSSGGKVYPLSKNWTTSSLHEGRFTAACGVFIYHGRLLANGQRKLAGEKSTSGDKHQPADAGRSPYHGAAFTCEPTGNLVHMEILTPKGATFEAKPHKKGVEFLATTDDWFRPVFLTHGPEGALYVVDMYRAVIEHPDFMPPELKNRPDLSAGKDKGRIWRIVPKDHKTKTPRPGLSKASIPELVKTLEQEEPWWRQTAQRLLLEKNDKAMIEPLTKLLETTKSPHAKILAAWMLERQGSLSDDSLIKMLKEPNARLAEHCVRIAERRVKVTNVSVWGNVASLNKHQDSRLRFQVALTVGEYKSPKRGHLGNPCVVLAEAAAVGADRWMRLAVESAPPDECSLMLADFLDDVRSLKGEALILARDLAAILGARKDLEDKTGPLLIVNRLSTKPATPEVKLSLLAGLSEGLERRGKTLISVTEELPSKDQIKYRDLLDVFFSDAAKVAGNPSDSAENRLLSLRLLSHARWAVAQKSLVPLVTEDALPELRTAALRALAAQQDKEVPALLIKLWPSAAPSVRREILEAMLRQPARVNVLLDEIEAKRMKASELDPLRTKQLVNHKDAAIRTRAAKLLASNIPVDRLKVLKEYQAALDLKGDAARGREIFKKECALCHRVAGLGVDVGPDIADTRTKTLSAMLNDILVPNAAIDANYVNYVVSTKDGRIVTGMMAVETASSITLKRAENQTDVVLRKDVDEIASTGISLMPEGLEKNISPQGMADLLSFLKNWRYLDGSVPTGK